MSILTGAYVSLPAPEKTDYTACHYSQERLPRTRYITRGTYHYAHERQTRRQSEKRNKEKKQREGEEKGKKNEERKEKKQKDKKRQDSKTKKERKINEKTMKDKTKRGSEERTRDDFRSRLCCRK